MQAKSKTEQAVVPTADAEARIAEAAETILRAIGEDPTRDGLVDTPGRVARAMLELTSGYASDPYEILGTVFEEPAGAPAGDLVVVEGIPFHALCEHHLLPVPGVATVGYVPSGRIVGLSKIPRLVDAFARRLQVQERLTDDEAGGASGPTFKQICKTLENVLDADFMPDAKGDPVKAVRLLGQDLVLFRDGSGAFV
jgi:GTP cyclohydrolase I